MSLTKIAKKRLQRLFRVFCAGSSPNCSVNSSTAVTYTALLRDLNCLYACDEHRYIPAARSCLNNPIGHPQEYVDETKVATELFFLVILSLPPKQRACSRNSRRRKLTDGTTCGTAFGMPQVTACGMET